MLVRLALITLVLGVALGVVWLGDADPIAPNSLALMGIIVGTYILTIIYAFALQRDRDPHRLATVQVSLDIATTALLVHITGGAQSAYTFFFPLSIIAAAATHLRRGAVLAAVAAAVLFSIISVLGWYDILPSLTGQRLLPSALSEVEFARAMAVNVAAFVGVGVLAYNLGGQIQQTSASLQSQRTKTADLQVLHRDIVRSLSSGLLTVDTAGRIVLTANRVACELLGYQGQDLAGKPVDEVFPELGALIETLPERDALRRVTIERQHPEYGLRILGVTVSPLRDNLDAVVGRIVNFQDLTEIRKLEENMRRSERLAVVGTLAAGVAHEIRNPLAAISGSIQLLAADPAADEDSRALMDIVTREADRLNGLITELLDYSNPQPRAIIHFDLVALVAETLTVFAQDPTYEQIHVSLTEDSASGPIEISADPGRLRQVLWNLIGNAAQAARSWVRVWIEIPDSDQIATSDARIVLPAVCIHVLDDGPGIAEEHIEHLFEPFFTTKEKGTGLGLATCHNIIAELQGSIQVENVVTDGVTAGCCFTVCLPLGRALPAG